METVKTDFAESMAGLNEYDKASFSFRYPVNKDDISSIEGLRHINIRLFSEKLEKALDLLDGALTGIESYLDDIGH